MKVIIDVKIAECKSPEMSVQKLKPQAISYWATKPEMTEIEDLETEIIKGQKIVTSNGQEITLGISKDVQRVLKIPFDLFHNYEDKIDKLEKDKEKFLNMARDYSGQVDNIRVMSFGQRLRFLFTRKLPEEET